MALFTTNGSEKASILLSQATFRLFQMLRTEAFPFGQR
jgi:hypothetical protein